MIVLHHLASSGGTIFAKALAAQGDCALLSEVSPYYSVIEADRFSPATPLEQFLARYHGQLPKEAGWKALEDNFRAQLRQVRELAADKTLIVREWSHGDFFVSNRFSSSVLPLIDFCETRSVVLLRHPVDCFLSGRTYHAWNMIHSDVEEFCRRYHLFCRFFLERPGVVIVKYEEFAEKADGVMEGLAQKLGLAFNPAYQGELARHRLSGSSGRFSTDRIAPRPRRGLRDKEREAFLKSRSYLQACERTGYPPDLSHGAKDGTP